MGFLHMEKCLSKNNYSHLVVDKVDFLVVYFASFTTMMFFFFGAWVVQSPDMSVKELWGDLWFVVPGAAIIALLPAFIARFIKTGRRITQLFFGAVLAPIIAVVVINGISIFKAL